MVLQDFIQESALKELIRRAQEGDTDAFGSVYDSFFEPVYRYAAFRLPKEVAEDVTADIFVKAWEKLHTYKIQKNVPFAAWLFRIARYTVIDVYRSQRTFDEISDALVDQDTFNQADSAAKRNYTLEMVRGSLEKLPERYRDVLTLFYIGDLSHSEIARVLRVSEGSVRILKMRALKKLEQLLPADSSLFV